MNALQILAALLIAPVRIVQIARDYERREVRETAVGWQPAEGWTREDADKSPSGSVEYYRTVRKNDNRY